MFYGLYSISDGTGKSFLSEPQETMEFPPQVMYENASYRYMRSYQVDTPSAEKFFLEYVAKLASAVDVKIPRKIK